MTWTRAHEAARQRILELMEREAKPFEDFSPEAQKARRDLALLPWCQTYLPHYFDKPFSRAHEAMAEVAGEAGMPTFIAAFRGFGKSVILALARPLYRALARKVPYFIYGAGVQKLAAQNMDYARLELEHNPRLNSDYPALRVEGSEEEWVLNIPMLKGSVSQTPRGPDGRAALRSCKFEAFGIGMSPRGKRHAEHRPLEFIGDDLENAEMARNPERERNLWDWLFDEIKPAMEPERYVFTVLGTMFGPDCMMQRARMKAAEVDPAGRPLAKTFTQPALNAEGRSVWPERFSDGELARERALIGLRNWNRNYALTAENPDAPFQPAWFELRFDAQPAGLDVVCFLDPALSLASSGCPRALIAVGADRNGLRHVLDAWIERGTPEQMLDKLFDFHARWKPRLLGIEQNGGYALIKPLLAVWESRRGYRLPVRYVNHSEAKELRIERLCPEMESGRWAWPERMSAGIRTLQDQFLTYPDGYVDGPDAAAGCCEFLGSAWGGGRRPGEPIHRSLTRRRDLAGVV